MADRFLDLVAEEASAAAALFREEACMWEDVGLPDRAEFIRNKAEYWDFIAQSCEGETSPYGIPLDGDTQEIEKAKS